MNNSRQHTRFRFPGILLSGVTLLLLMIFPSLIFAQQTGQEEPPREQQSAEGQGRPTGELEEGQVNFQATDSLTFDLRDGRKANLFGSARVTHQAGELTAGKITLDIDETTVRAATQTPEDTLSQPVLTRDGDEIRSESIAFNYKTEKGRFEVARVQIEDGKVTGTRVKNTDAHTVFLEDAIYSTCTLDHPHYYIKADRMKLVNEEEIFFTNAQLYILDIPYPLIFPFGYIPGNLEQRESGLLEPTYARQNRETRGLGIQNIGWFQYFNDYLVGEISGDIYTSGTFFMDASLNYSNRDKYSGGIDLGYSRERGLEPTDPDFATNIQKKIQFDHQQEFSPYANMSTNIEWRTADYNRRNSFDPDERAEVSTSSNLNYRYRHPEDAYNFNISARQNQNFQTNVTRLSGPTARFNLRRFTPFESDGPATEEAPWYENLSIQYQNTLESNYDFNPIDADSAQVGWFEALLDPSKYREATGEDDHFEYGFRQQGSMSLSNLLSSPFLNLSANGNITEYWFPTSTRKTYNPETEEVEEQKVRGFEAARDFSTSLNFSTTVYGLMNQNIGNFESFRHTFEPSLSFSYRPDFSSSLWGYYREVQTDPEGNTEKYSIFEDEVFNGPGRGEQQSIGISVRNVFEAKQVKRDSTGETNENNIRLLDQLNFNTSYNLAADSLKLSNLSVNMSSSAISMINLRANAQFNFYDRDENGNRIDTYLLESDRKPAEMTNFSINASANFSGGQGGGINVNEQEPHFPAEYDPFNQSIFQTMDPQFNAQPVQPIKSPWSFSVNFRYSWTLNPTGNNDKSATLNANNIQLQLTPKWSFNTRIGYDFIDRDLTPSQFSMSRRLHEWNLSFTINPFGDFQYYAFKLSVNNSQVQSLFQKLPILNNLERSSSPSGRNPSGF